MQTFFYNLLVAVSAIAGVSAVALLVFLGIAVMNKKPEVPSDEPVGKHRKDP